MDFKLFAVCLMVLAVSIVSAASDGNEQAKDHQFGGKGNAFMEVANESAVNHHSRQKRATCDLASGANLNHTLCAAHCIMRGFRGGYCNDKAVCVCRK